MKYFRRGNREVTAEDNKLDYMIEQGYDEIDSKTGAIINPKLSEIDKLKREIRDLRKENKELKAQLEK